jgi:hypothetical protein
MNRIRIFRSPDARYYAEDVLEGPEIYTDEALAGMAGHGFNGIWLRIRLRDATRTAIFPELGARAEAYRQALSTLCARAARHGIGVYLYLNEPLCFPADDPFWAAHPEVRGANGASGMDEWPHTVACCTSHPAMQAWLRTACADLFRHCPQLAGVLTITASEHHTHCYSHAGGGGTACPRCGGRDVAEVVAEVNNLIHAGIVSVAPQATVIAWNWSWKTYSHEAQQRIIQQLEPSIVVMADWERGGTKRILGKERAIDEYSLAYVGPSEEFTAVQAAAVAGGRTVWAKLQIGTTHEIATVNNLPLIPNLLGKARRLRERDVAGALCCWNFGNRLTLNTWAFNRFLDDPQLAAKDDATVLAETARGYLGVTDPAPVLQAWERFVAAFDHYPFHNCFLYSAPVNYAPAYPLPRPGDPDRPMPWNWVPLKKPYGTRLIQTVEHEWGHTGYTLEEYRDAFRAMARLFGDGLADYRRALEDSPRPEARRELRNAIVIHHILRSTANIYAAYLICRATPFDAKAWHAIADDEAAHLAEVEPLLAGETEIGWHSEAADWFFTQADIAAKRRGLAADGPLAACDRATRGGC